MIINLSACMSVASSTWMLKSPTMISGAEKVVNRSSMSLKSSKNDCVAVAYKTENIILCIAE